MFNVGQVLQDTKKNEPVIYCGFVLDMHSRDDSPAGVYIFRKDATAMEIVDSLDDFKPYGEYPNIDLGTFVDDLDMCGIYFGVMQHDWMSTPHNHTSALHALEEAERRYHGGER